MCRGSHTRKRPPERKTRSGVLFLVVVVVAMDAGLVGSGGVGNGGRGRDVLGRATGQHGALKWRPRN
jgi:hypothetical protein